ncbi:hypothetical protein ACQI4L_09160 [Mycolicibacterium litorale]|uniref:hypothetical protein n=1 Tax=Mycolicibacterium litorale TaxID=758802 RepID=UPI003CE6DDE3
MTVFPSAYAERAWRESHCRRCYQPDEAMKRVVGSGPGCPLLQIAASGVVPEQWTKRRKAEMGNTYTCADFRKRPPVARKGRVEPMPQEELFDAPEPAEKLLVPVEGWPDYAALQRKAGADHQ